MLEVFHLKLNLILQTLEETRSAIRFQQLPFLLLGAESFRLQLFELGTGLPLFWSAQVDLAESNCALAISVAASDARYFIPPELAGPSIYRPQTRSLLHGVRPRYGSEGYFLQLRKERVWKRLWRQMSD